MQQLELMIWFVSVPFGSNKIIVENYFLDEYCEIFRKKMKKMILKKCAQTSTDV